MRPSALPSAERSAHLGRKSSWCDYKRVGGRSFRTRAYAGGLIGSPIGSFIGSLLLLGRGLPLRGLLLGRLLRLFRGGLLLRGLLLSGLLLDDLLLDNLLLLGLLRLGVRLEGAEFVRGLDLLELLVLHAALEALGELLRHVVGEPLEVGLHVLGDRLRAGARVVLQRHERGLDHLLVRRVQRRGGLLGRHGARVFFSSSHAPPSLPPPPLP